MTIWTAWMTLSITKGIWSFMYRTHFWVPPIILDIFLDKSPIDQLVSNTRFMYFVGNCISASVVTLCTHIITIETYIGCRGGTPSRSTTLKIFFGGPDYHIHSALFRSLLEVCPTDKSPRYYILAVMMEPMSLRIQHDERPSPDYYLLPWLIF